LIIKAFQMPGLGCQLVNPYGRFLTQTFHKTPRHHQ
jgi:hypothetical protein